MDCAILTLLNGLDNAYLGFIHCTAVWIGRVTWFWRVEFHLPSRQSSCGSIELAIWNSVHRKFVKMTPLLQQEMVSWAVETGKRDAGTSVVQETSL